MIQPNFSNPTLYSGPGLMPVTTGGGSLGQLSLPIKTDVQLINDSIYQICMTNPKERLMRPSFGAGIGLLLFETVEIVQQKLAQMVIARAIASIDPRITLNYVSVTNTVHTVQVNYGFRIVKVGLNAQGFLEFPKEQ